MKILMLNANTHGTGTFHRALWFARMCARYGGHEVMVSTVHATSRWKRHTYDDIPGVTISAGPAWGYRFMPGYGSNILDIAWRTRAIKNDKYDVIYAFEYHPNVAWPLAWAAQPHHVIISDWCDWYGGAANHFRGNKLLHAWDTRREERIRHRAHHVSVISSTLARRAEAIGIASSHISLIREGVDTTYMTPHPSDDVRRALGIPSDARVVGTLHDGDAFPALVAACARIRRMIPHIRLLLIGKKRPSHTALTRQHGIDDIFCSTGWCTDADLPRYISAADVCALPLADTCAHRARFPHKIGDYLACARPVVVTDVGDYPALLKDADAASVCPPDETAFTDALTRMLNDDAAQAYYGDRGRQWVVSQLDWRHLAPSILQCIENASNSQYGR